METAEVYFLTSIFTSSPLKSHSSARLGILEIFDGIAFFIDHSDDENLQYSKEELDGIISHSAISQPIVVLVQTQNASGSADDSELISKFGLENLFKKGKGRISIFAYTLSPTRFTGCLEGQL